MHGRSMEIGFDYEEAVGEELDALVAKAGGGELEVAEVAGEDASGHGHRVVDKVHHDGGCGEFEEEFQLDPGGLLVPRRPCQIHV